MKKGFLVGLALLLICPLASATLEQYVAGLDTSFYDGTINITAFGDSMSDTDSDGLNDTLIFNLTTDYATSENFTARVFFDDNNLPVLSDTRMISSGNPTFYMNLSTFYLTEPQYTYFVRIYNSIGQIVYESTKYNTSNYSSYETGTNVSSISDENINNDLIRINVSLNVKRNETVNITVNMDYNGSAVSSTKEASLTTPSQTVLVDFDNETIKATHYSGAYNITSIAIGEKLMQVGQATSSYNYETFAKTSYIKAIASDTYDNDANNLSDAFRFNFTVEVKSADTYAIDADLYDSSDTYLMSIAGNATLSAGTQLKTIEIDGVDIYSTYYNGEFELRNVLLSIGNATYDLITDAHTTNPYYYADFERPPLPDLQIRMNTTTVSNDTNVTINIANKGNAPAFNIFVNVFNNESYSNESSTAYLDINESEKFTFQAHNTANTTFVAIVDFNNIVDESNESNNVADNMPPQVSLSIIDSKELYSDGRRKIIGFTILNDGEENLDNISWSVDTDNGSVIQSTYSFNLSVNESIPVIFEYDYTTPGTYTIEVNATNIDASDSAQFVLSVDELDVSSFTKLYSNSTTAVFEFVVENVWYLNKTFSWSFDTNDTAGVVWSTNTVTLVPDENLTVLFEHNFSTTGNYSLVAAANTTRTYSELLSTTLN